MHTNVVHFDYSKMQLSSIQTKRQNSQLKNEFLKKGKRVVYKYGKEGETKKQRWKFEFKQKDEKDEKRREKQKLGDFNQFIT